MKTSTDGKNGIRQLYIGFVKSHLKKKCKVEKISRQKIELQLFEEIDKWDFPIEYKMSWYHEVLVSSNFDGFWVEVSERFNLPASCTTRYVTDRNLLEYDVPTDDEADESVEDKIHNDTAAAEKSSPTSVPHTPGLVTDHESRSSTPDSSDESSRESTPDTWPQLSEAALTRPTPVILRCTKCGLRGSSARYCACNYYHVVDGKIGEPLEHLAALDEDQTAASGGLSCEEEDDGEYEDPPSKTNGKGKAPGPVKAASKPHGVTKNRAAPKKKEQTPAQLKTAAAKTREPAKREAAKTKSPKPKATKNAVTTPDQNLDTPSHTASNGNNEQSQVAPRSTGIKRSMEQFRDDDDDDSPATKKAKIGGAASANGGRKKAIPKSNKKKDDFEEWDGIPRGFGEY